MYVLVIQEWGYIFAAVIFCALTLAMMTVCCACIFLHLAYYLTGYYIRLLRHGLLTNSNIGNTVKFVNGWVTDGNNSAAKTSVGYMR